MEALEKRRSIIDHIFEDLENLKTDDLIAISNFSESLSKITTADKKTDEDTISLLKFYKQEKKQDPIPSDLGEAAIKLFNVQRFSYLQKIFRLKPDLINFLLVEKNDMIDVFLIERLLEDNNMSIPCLDIAYRNSTDGKYYYMDDVDGGIEMTDFVIAQTRFIGHLKIKLDIGQNPNKHTCPTKIMIDRSHFQEFKDFELGKMNPKIYLITAINLDKTESDFFKRVTLVMNFGEEVNDVFIPDMNYYFDTYHLCPPGTC